MYINTYYVFEFFKYMYSKLTKMKIRRIGLKKIPFFIKRPKVKGSLKEYFLYIINISFFISAGH